MPFTVQEKLDGSLGLLFSYKGTWQVASRGSFVGPQVQLAEELLTSRYDPSALTSGVTYVFVLIHPRATTSQLTMGSVWSS